MTICHFGNLVFHNLVFYNLVFYNLVFYNLVFYNLVFYNLVSDIEMYVCSTKNIPTYLFDTDDSPSMPKLLPKHILKIHSCLSSHAQKNKRERERERERWGERERGRGREMGRKRERERERARGDLVVNWIFGLRSLQRTILSN
jgi:hypothetical protein